MAWGFESLHPHKFNRYWNIWRGGRVVDCGSLENCWAATLRGFESLPLRRKKNQGLGQWLNRPYPQGDSAEYYFVCKLIRNKRWRISHSAWMVVQIRHPWQMQLNNGFRVAPGAVSAIPPAFANSLTAKVLQKALGSTPNGCAKNISGCSSVGRAGGLGPSGRTFEPCHPDDKLLKHSPNKAPGIVTLHTPIVAA